MKRVTRARGDERLSGKDRGEPGGAGQSRRPRRPAQPERNARKQRSSDVGRALRSVYDDTLRESVPDEFIDHASREQILADAGLTAPKIAQDVVAQVLGTRVPIARQSTDDAVWSSQDVELRGPADSASD